MFFFSLHLGKVSLGVSHWLTDAPFARFAFVHEGWKAQVHIHGGIWWKKFEFGNFIFLLGGFVGTFVVEHAHLHENVLQRSDWHPIRQNLEHFQVMVKLCEEFFKAARILFWYLDGELWLNLGHFLALDAELLREIRHYQRVCFLTWLQHRHVIPHPVLPLQKHWAA